MKDFCAPWMARSASATARSLKCWRMPWMADCGQAGYSFVRRRPMSYLHVIATVLILMVRPAAAQVLTGNLFGTVKDASGAVLPVAAVKVLSPVLFSGVATTAANDKGQFRIP